MKYSIHEEKILFSKMDHRGVPKHLQQGLVDYIIHGRRPGDFLCAVLANDLQHSLRSSKCMSNKGPIDLEDVRISLEDLRALVVFLVWDAPAKAWGSTERVRLWKGLASWKHIVAPSYF